MASGFTWKVDEKSSAWDTLRKTLENMQTGEAYIKAGVIGAKAEKNERHGDGKKPSKLTNGELARIHEFGVPDHIPARPFILGTFTLNRAKYIDLLKTKILPGIYRAKITVSFGLKVIGEIMASDMRNRMVEGPGIPPPNAPSTIAAKKRKGRWNKGGKSADEEPRPLIDTGRLRNSISYAVVVKDEAEILGDAPGTGPDE